MTNPTMRSIRIMPVLAMLLITSFFTSCKHRNQESKEEQITVDGSQLVPEADSILNSVHGNIPLGQIPTKPTAVILTGLADHRLITVYKAKLKSVAKDKMRFYSYSDNDAVENEVEEHFMPGFDILYGYNLLNIAHYDLKAEKLNYLFSKPALIKTLYYPSFNPDSVDKKPINRNFYLVSAYDEDTNKDTLINRKDLRRFYHFDETAGVKTQLVPANYSVFRSQYDPKNDIMYLFARLDENKNGTIDDNEPVHIFWFSLKAPAAAKRLY